MHPSFARCIGPLTALLVFTVSGGARAQAASGVSDERVSLPEAPGALGGVGENAFTDGNQGALRYRVPVEVPAGFPGVTPGVDLTYSSSSGSGVVGIGWAMPSFSIERMTSKGLQRYALDDRFAAEGFDELVRVEEGASSATYRARFEGGFIRYTWHQRGTGEAGYWVAEYPDGRVGYFGADTTGAAVPTARVIVPGTSKVFRWHLVALVDAFGHEMRLNWTKDGSGHPLLERIDYLYEGANPRHSVRFTYEARPDVLSDARPGFELLLTRRLKDVRVLAGAEVVRTYVLEYESEDVSGGASRLRRVSRLGRNAVPFPISFNFGYSRTLGGACEAGCDKPFVRQMGTLGGVDFTTGRATLIDMNGDALPDVLVSDAQGRHSFYYARLDAEGAASFEPTPVASARTPGSSPFVLGDARVQVMDVNGDGFVDITQAKLPAVLCNDGSGDWADASVCTGTEAPALPGAYTPEDEGDTPQADPKYVRFFDYDNDKRIDWLRTLAGGSGTQVLANTPEGFQPVSVDNIGAVFDDGPLQLADMNGDGLQDPVQLVASGAAVVVQYKLNLGLGQWSDWRSITLTGLDASQATLAELQDINGDGLADVVAVSGDEVHLALNRSGDRFDAVLTLTSADLGAGSIPARKDTTVVAYADMNGNGSDDIVWIESDGGVQYLELFPVRPNLISRIDNGIGAVQLVTYGTSIVEQARDAAAGRPWAWRVPHPMTLVKRMDSYVTLTGSDSGGLRESTAMAYHSGYYDGVEKQFRGYEQVERELLGDLQQGAQESGLFVETYDVGRTHPALAGLKRKQTVHAGDARALLVETQSAWEVCPVAQVPEGVTPTVGFACERSTTTVLVEREEAGAATTRVERDYDGYGNMVAERNLGVVHLGTPAAPRTCEPCVASGLFGRPCGDTCQGDELFSRTDYVVPGPDTQGAWFTAMPWREALGAVETALEDETLTFYDGPDFEGLPAGQLTRGGVARVSRRSGPGTDAFLVVDRYRLDAHGNVLEHIPANGSVADASNWRRLYTYEPAGLHATSVEVRTSGAAGEAQALRRDVVHEPTFEQVSQSSSWYPLVAGSPAATAQLTRYRYDEHGRLLRVLEPGDSESSPSQELRYEYADPASRVLVLQRSSPTSGQDVVSARCFDGRGRLFQTRTKLAEDRWQVDGFVEFDARGAVVRRYQPYVAGSGECEQAPPAGVASTRFTFDALGRQLSEEEPDGSLRRREYGALVTRLYDEDDTAASSAHPDTPILEEVDGLGRLVATHRLSAPEGSGSPAVVAYQYDALGRMAVVRDAAGNLHVQTYDLLGRLTSVAGTNSGQTLFEYDGNGNEVRRTDARGSVVRSAYDGANRLIAQWDEANEAATRVSWRYDLLEGCTECTNAGGKLVEMRWPNGASLDSERFGYDATGNLLYAERSIAGHAFVTRRRYDGVDRELATVYPGGLTVERSWDGAGRLSAMEGLVDRVDYTAQGELAEVAFSNGTSTRYAYDGRRRLQQLTTTARDGSPVVDLRYTRTPRGDLQSIGDGDRPGRSRHAARFTYDAWDRLTRTELDRQAGDAEVLDFTYDAIDNVLSQSSSLGTQSRAHVGSYTYEAARPNAVVQAGSLSLGYDEAGALASRGGLTYVRDHLGRITSVSREGQAAGRFVYSGTERVVREEAEGGTTWWLAEDFELRDGISVVYARMGEARVARLQSDALAATVLSDLAPATGSGSQLSPQGDSVIDVGDAWVARAAEAGVAQLSGGPTPSPVDALLRSAARRLLVEDVVWLHQDHLQSTVAATDQEGGLRAEQSFYPTGELRERTGYVDAYGFTGQQEDVSTGLVHFLYRELDPRTGRWDRPDPAFEELNAGTVRYLGQATGAYAYVGNAFVNASDPTGLVKGGKLSASWVKGSVKSAVKQRFQSGRKEKALRIAQVVTALGSAVASMVGAAVSYEASQESTAAAEDQSDPAKSAQENSERALQAAREAQLGSSWGMAASALGATSTALGASIDTYNTFKRGREETDLPELSPSEAATSSQAGSKGSGQQGGTSSGSSQGAKGPGRQSLVGSQRSSLSRLSITRTSSGSLSSSRSSSK